MLLKSLLPSTLSNVGIRAFRGKDGLATFALMIVVAFALVSGPASATPNDVIVDYRADGAIDGTYSADELYDALTQWKQTGATNYGAFDSAISGKLDQLTLGVTPNDPPARPPEGQHQHNAVIPVPVPVVPPAASPLPTPPPASVTSRPPLVFIGLTALAALLLLAGVATALARRINLDQK